GGLDLDDLEEALKAGFGIRDSGFAEPEAAGQGPEGKEGEGGADVAPGGARPSEESEIEGEESPGQGESANPEPRIPNPDAANPEPRNPNPDGGPPDLREVTATAWDRVRFLEWWSRWERREMRAILLRSLGKARVGLEALLRLFRGYKKILFEARHYEAKLQDALFRFLSRLNGEDPGFERPNSVWIDPEAYKKMKNDMEGVWGE
ncbi:MAG TPA: hypothetical protein VKM93_16315, partial [Terriglobia bacterium]|nr:hypothetical protein [Terriglobia bacterium]